MRRKKVEKVKRIPQSLPTTQELKFKFLNLFTGLSEDLIRKGMKGTTVTLKLKTDKFELFTRSKTVPTPFNNKNDLIRIGMEIFDKNFSQSKMNFRLLGIQMSKFTTKKQNTIKKYFSNQNEKKSDGIEDIEETENPDELEENFQNFAKINENPDIEASPKTSNLSIINENPEIASSKPKKGIGFS